MSTSTRNTGSDDKDSLVVIPLETKQMYDVGLLDRHSRRIQLVPGDQRPGRYYSGIKQYNVYSRVRSRHDLNVLPESDTDFLDGFFRAISKKFLKRKDLFSFFPRIYMAC